MRYSFLLLVAFLFAISAHHTASCQVKVARDILVLRDSKDLPAQAKRLGKVRGAATFGGYEKAVQKAMKRAERKGCNAILVSDVKYPNFFRGRLHVRAYAYHLDNTAGLTEKRKQQVDAIVEQLLPGSAPYGLLYAGRPAGQHGAALRYNLHVRDSVVCRVRNRRKYLVELHEKGNTAIWARTEARETQNIKVEPGKVYFLNCSVAMGLFVARPDLRRVNTYYGIEEMLRYNYKN